MGGDGKRREYTDDQLREAIERSKTWYGVAGLLLLTQTKKCYSELRARALKAGIDFTKLDAQIERRKMTDVPYYLRQARTSALKIVFFRRGVFQKECSHCHIGPINGDVRHLILVNEGGFSERLIGDDPKLYRILCRNCKAILRGL